MRYLFLFLLFSSQSVFGQFSIGGKITNAAGEPLEFAVVYLENTDKAVVTNEKGQFELRNIPNGELSLKVTHSSYQPEVMSLTVDRDLRIDIQMMTLAYALGSIDIVANKLTREDPFRYENVSKKDIQNQNVGIDLPTTLQNITSLTTTSDAGHGIGYSSLSLRGSDQTRINVTINGVPVNDAESQNVFWVNMPDLLSSTESIQVQRGVGSSTNGPGAFGGSLLINTKNFNQNPFLSLATSAGSFGTLRGNIAVGTGLMNNKYYLEGRYSYITSDGYIDRASSQLNGLYIAGGILNQKSSLRFQVVSGKEITYQSWNGIPEAKLNGTEDDLKNHYSRNLSSLYKTVEDSINLFSSDRRYNYYQYENQVDNYRQTQAQLSYSRELMRRTSLSATAFYTYGTGYFEQFKPRESFEAYGYNNVEDEDGNLISEGDLARRKWLRNHYFGVIADVKGSFGKNQTWQTGVFASHYAGSHFGEIVRVWFSTPTNIWGKYYDNKGEKSDYSAYARMSGTIMRQLHWFGDVQVRKVNYSINGLLEDFITANILDNNFFFNPKAGISFYWNSANKLLASVAVAHKELSRSDYVDHISSQVDPSPERLVDYEIAYQYTSKKISFQSGFYFMNYHNQLVLNGNLNDVGAPLRINVPESFRLGWETETSYTPSKKWTLSANFTWSRNQIKNFTETLYDYTQGFEVVKVSLGTTPIAYSPEMIGNVQIQYTPIPSLNLIWNSKYVSSQFLDNTGNPNRQLPQYSVHGFRTTYSLYPSFCRELTIQMVANNVFNQKYSGFGYTYSYIYEDLVTENFYFPQAGINVYGGINIRF